MAFALIPGATKTRPHATNVPTSIIEFGSREDGDKKAEEFCNLLWRNRNQFKEVGFTWRGRVEFEDRIYPAQCSLGSRVMAITNPLLFVLDRLFPKKEPAATAQPSILKKTTSSAKVAGEEKKVHWV